MALFPQFPYSNLHELNLDWIIEQIRQIEGEGVVLSVNGLSGVVTLYTDKDVVFPDLNYNDHWQIFREIDNKIAGLKFTGEKFFYITKNEGDEEFTVQEVYTSGNQPPYPVRSVNGQTGDVTISVPVTSVNGRTGNVMLAGDNIPYNIDGTYTIEDIITPLEKSIGRVIRYNTCAEGVSAGQYVYLILSGISGRSDGLYRAVNAKSAGTIWTSADLAPVAGGLGALMASNDSAISELNSKFSVIQTGTDLRTIRTSGMYFVQASCTNGWSGDPHFMIVIAGGGRATQLAISSTAIQSGIRNYINESWTDWKIMTLT